VHDLPNRWRVLDTAIAVIPVSLMAHDVATEADTLAE